jgi:hypothetical protein
VDALQGEKSLMPGSQYNPEIHHRNSIRLKGHDYAGSFPCFDPSGKRTGAFGQGTNLDIITTFQYTPSTKLLLLSILTGGCPYRQKSNFI